VIAITGTKKTLCDGLTRRDLIRIGSVSALGLGLGDFLRLQGGGTRSGHGPSERAFGRARACVLLYLFGAPSQLETFDPKPDAPADVRGELSSIATSLPGIRIGELLPRTARVMDRTTVVRSMTHSYPIHGVAYAITATPTIDIPMQLNARDARHWPFIGSVVQYLDEHRGRPAPAVPRNVALPWLLSSRRAHPSRDGGPYGHFLGPTYDPVWTEFQGDGTKEIYHSPSKKVIHDPYGGIKPDSRFPLAAADTLPVDVSPNRLNDRKCLLRRFDATRRAIDSAARSQRFDHYQAMAFGLIASSRTREALDVSREPLSIRERYGMHLFGQATLVARRLVEAGARFVTVFWDDYPELQTGWDTHFDHYPRMKQVLCPGLDQTWSALLLDLETRGLLGETLVACLSEHGRTPKLDSSRKGGGRDHWSRAYSAAFAGGGMARGQVVGKTDRIAGDVVDTPVSPKDVLATAYHLLGLDPETMIQDRAGRPLPIAGEGRVRPELLG
jgi:hypothetical protein